MSMSEHFVTTNAFPLWVTGQVSKCACWLAGCLVVGLAWLGPAACCVAWGAYWCWGTDSLLDPRDTWWTGCCLDWRAVTAWLVRDNVLAGSSEIVNI